MALSRFRPGSAVAVAAALLIGLTGCAAPDDSSPDPAKSDPATEEGTTAKSGAGVADIDPDDVIVSQTVSVPGSADDTAEIGIHSLTVEGDVQVLRVVITPHFESASDSDDVSIYDVWGGRRFSPQLVDMENLKVYSVVSETGQDWASDSVFTEAQNGEPFSAWAVYAAPEDDVESFDVRMSDSWPEFTDVPITR